VDCCNSIVTDPKSPGRVYFCYFDIGLLVSDDHGQSFRRSGQGMKNAGNCFTVVIDPDDSNHLWAGSGE